MVKIGADDPATYAAVMDNIERDARPGHRLGAALGRHLVLLVMIVGVLYALGLALHACWDVFLWGWHTL